MRLRLRFPIYRTWDEYGDRITALRKPWWLRRKRKITGVRENYVVMDEVYFFDQDTTFWTEMLAKLPQAPKHYWNEDEFMPRLSGQSLLLDIDWNWREAPCVSRS